jgi:RES domain-containing protein
MSAAPKRAPIRVWRITTSKYARSAFSGEGARLYGGRWNHKGVTMVYTAQSQALAMLEMLVQDEPLRARYALIPADIPANLAIERITAADLSRNWRSAESLENLRTRGTQWAKENRSVALAVPSAVVPAEMNFLLNPLHPDFKRIRIGKSMPLVTDLRMLKKPKP